MRSLVNAVGFQIMNEAWIQNFWLRKLKLIANWSYLASYSTKVRTRRSAATDVCFCM